MSNTWMNNSQYLAQVGHFFGAYFVIFTVAVFSVALGAGWVPVLIVLGTGVITAAIKEFLYDMTQELPKQTWGDSLMDFGFYMLGGGVAMGMSALLAHLAHW